MKLKRTVTVEFDLVRITTPRCAGNCFRCESCGAKTEFLSQTQAAELIKIMQTQGLNLNRENLHFYQRDEERILVCLNSITSGSASGTIK